MPIIRTTVNGKPAYKTGKHGKAYAYTPGNEASRKKAKQRAINQELARSYQTGRKPHL